MSQYQSKYDEMVVILGKSESKMLELENEIRIKDETIEKGED